MTPLDKAEAVLASMRGEVECATCRDSKPKDQIVNPDRVPEFGITVRYPICDACLQRALDKAERRRELAAIRRGNGRYGR